MKQGRTLQELAVEIERQNNAKKDYLVSTEALRMSNDNGYTTLDIPGMDPMGLTDVAHSQIGAYLEIPSRYYQRMRDSNPDLLVENVNGWLERTPPASRMVRTLDGRARAFLSDKYRRIDNVQVAEAVLPIIARMPGAEVKSCEITDNKMYIKVVNPRLTENVSVGDTVQGGILISNSEIGLGSVMVTPLIYRLVCSNGMVITDGQVRKNHIGRTNESDVDYSILRSETIEAEDKAFIMKLQDAVTAATDEAMFRTRVKELQDSKDAKIEPVIAHKVVELTAKQVGITQFETEGVLGHLIAGGDLSLYGIGNAVTRYAQDVSSYDRSTDLEAIGYRIISLAPAMFNSILKTARKEVIDIK